MRAKLFHSNTYHHNFLQIASSCHRRHRCQQMPVGNCGVRGGDESKLQREKEEKTLTAYLLRTAYTAFTFQHVRQQPIIIGRLNTVNSCI